MNDGTLIMPRCMRVGTITSDDSNDNPLAAMDRSLYEFFYNITRGLERKPIRWTSNINSGVYHIYKLYSFMPGFT